MKNKWLAFVADSGKHHVQPWELAYFLSREIPREGDDLYRLCAEVACGAYGHGFKVPRRVLETVKQFFVECFPDQDKLLAALDDAVDLGEADRRDAIVHSNLLVRAVELALLLGVDPPEDFPGIWSTVWPQAALAIEEAIKRRLCRRAGRHSWASWICYKDPSTPSVRRAVESNVRRLREALCGKEPDFDEVAQRLTYGNGADKAKEYFSNRSFEAAEKALRSRLPGGPAGGDCLQYKTLDHWLDFAFGTTDRPGHLPKFQRGLVAMVYRTPGSSRHICIGPVLKLAGTNLEVDPHTNLPHVLKATPRWLWFDGERVPVLFYRSQREGEEKNGKFTGYLQVPRDEPRGRSTRIWVQKEVMQGGGLDDLPKPEVVKTTSFVVREQYEVTEKLGSPQQQSFAVGALFLGEPLAAVLESAVPHRPDCSYMEMSEERREFARRLYCDYHRGENPAEEVHPALPTESTPFHDWKKDFSGWFTRLRSLFLTVQFLCVRFCNILGMAGTALLTEFTKYSEQLFQDPRHPPEDPQALQPFRKRLAEVFVEARHVRPEKVLQAAARWWSILSRMESLIKTHRKEYHGLVVD